MKLVNSLHHLPPNTSYTHVYINSQVTIISITSFASSLKNTHTYTHTHTHGQEAAVALYDISLQGTMYVLVVISS